MLQSKPWLRFAVQGIGSGNETGRAQQFCGSSVPKLN